MSQTILSDEALQQAAASVRQSLLDSLPPPFQCEHEFSDTFQAKMKRMIARYNLRRTVCQAARRVAAVFLAALIGAGVWLAVDAEARAAFSSWVREVYEEHIVYRFFGEPAAKELPAYRITWLPDGYEEVDIFDSGETYNVLYQKGDDLMSAFIFDYRFVQSGTLSVMEIDNASYIHKIIDMNGVQADFYEALIPNETNNLIWVDEDVVVVFELNGFLDESVMMHIAESIVLTNPTK